MGGDAGSPWGQAGGPGERDRKSIGGQTGVPPRDRQEVHREQAGSPQSRVWWRSMGMAGRKEVHRGRTEGTSFSTIFGLSSPSLYGL